MGGLLVAIGSITNHGFPNICAAWYHGSDHRDVAFSIKCDVRAVEGLGCKDAEHATVESAEGSRATDTAIVSDAIYCAKAF